MLKVTSLAVWFIKGFRQLVTGENTNASLGGTRVKSSQQSLYSLHTLAFPPRANSWGGWRRCYAREVYENYQRVASLRGRDKKNLYLKPENYFGR